MLRHERTIRFHDTDRAGMVFHGAFVTYFQDAFEDLMADIGYPERSIEASLGVRVPVVHIEIDFHEHPVGDRIVVEIALAKVGTSSATFHLRVLDARATVCADATVVRVCIDGAGAATPIPAALRKAWASHLTTP